MEVLIMRAVLIMMIAALVTASCSKEETEVTTTLSESEAVSTNDVDVTRKGSDEPELKASRTAGKGTIDPVLKDYTYPNSALDGKSTTGKVLSYFFVCPDEFEKVVEYYQKKFPDSPPPSGTNASYAKTVSDGTITVTVTGANTTSQIILRLDKT